MTEPNVETSDNLLLNIENLKVSFFTPAGEVKAVNDTSLYLRPKEVLGVVGESGSGKSVTAYSVLNILSNPGEITGGHVHFNGHEIEKMTEEEMRKIRGNEVSIIFQDSMTSLNPVYTVGNQIMEVLLLHTTLDRKDAWKRAVELLNLVGVSEPEKRMKQYPHEFSGGMRQRVMIAMALACEPKMLIADEPTTALDVTIQAQIFELIAELKEKLNMAIMLITHDLGVVADICERIIIMYAGKIVEYGSVRDIFYRHTHPYTAGLFNSLPRLDSDAHQRLVPIEGSPVDLLNPPAGCPFAPRCPQCMKICLRTPPPYVEVGEGHSSACWLLLKDQAEKTNEEAQL